MRPGACEKTQIVVLTCSAVVLDFETLVTRFSLTNLKASLSHGQMLGEMQMYAGVSDKPVSRN